MNLGDEKMKVISGILANLGQICIASLVIPFAIGNTQNTPTFIIGSLLAMLFWSASVAFIRDNEKI